MPSVGWLTFLTLLDSVIMFVYVPSCVESAGQKSSSPSNVTVVL